MAALSEAGDRRLSGLRDTQNHVIDRGNFDSTSCTRSSQWNEDVCAAQDCNMDRMPSKSGSGVASWTPSSKRLCIASTRAEVSEDGSCIQTRKDNWMILAR